MKAIISLALLLTISGCSKIWKDYPQDNIAEEVLEEVIEQKTGLDIDLSPETKENAK